MSSRAKYNAIAAYNNSFLSNVKNWLQNKELIKETQAMRFGTALHEWELEPEKFKASNHGKLTVKEFDKLQKMKETLRKSSIWKQLSFGAEKEIVRTWTDQTTGMRCKGIIDVKKWDFISDLKTTSCFTQSAFEDAILKYEYQRQAAFYLDGTRAESFVFAPISKTKTDRMFFIELHRDSELIQQGRKMYRFLLNKCKEYKIEPGCDLATIGTPVQRLAEIQKLEA